MPALVASAQAAAPIYADSHGYRFAVNGNRLLPAEVVVAVIESAETPQQALDALRLAYQKAGYPLVAFRGEVRDKLVAIDVINGRITALDVTPPSLTPFFTSLKGQEDLHLDTLIRTVSVAEFFAAREGMRPKVNFVAAEEVGGSKLVATEEPIEGASPWNAAVSFGNLGSRYSSRYLAQASGAIRPGGGLELAASYGQGIPGLSSDSAGSLYHSGALSASLVTPWGLYGVSFLGTDYKIGERAYPLYPEGQLYVGSITGSQLVFADPTSRLTLSEAFTHTDNSTYVFEGLYQLTDQSYDLVSVGATGNSSFALFGLNASLSASVTANFGITPPRGTFLPTGLGIPSTRFAQVVGNVAYVQSLPEGWSAALTWSGQWADSTLPQNQQWVLGGFGNLSAWLPAIMVGDKGTLGRATVSTPTWQWEGFSATGTAFAEWGLAGLDFAEPGVPSVRGASDAGISVSASYSTGTQLLFAYAWPLGSRNVPISALNRQGKANLYFSLSQSF
ncbi:MAG: ShlB/FhaC/HecB family hemolysin secretion/activation protein [Burkholderiales bacterium]